MKSNLEWNRIMQNNTVFAVRDPITGSVQDKAIFYESFQTILDQIDGSQTEDSVDYFFNITPLNPGILEFIGEDEKSEFIDWAIQHNLLPKMQEIMEGENQKTKHSRQQEEEFLKLEDCADISDNESQVMENILMEKVPRNKPKQKSKPKLSDVELKLKIASNMKRGLDKLLNKPNPNPDKLTRSIAKLRLHILDSLQNFPENPELTSLAWEMQTQLNIDFDLKT